MNEAFKTVETEEYPFPHVVAKRRRVEQRFSGNTLVRALPAFPNLRSLKHKLQVLPTFTEKLRRRGAQHRRLRLRQMARFFLALPNVCELAEHIHMEICEGYVGRELHTPGANRRMQAEYLRNSVERTTPEGGTALKLCSALMGIPGSGKTFAIGQIARLFPPIIFHREDNLWQIPLLIIQMPYKNNSGTSLPYEIISAIARLFPPGDYVNLYLSGRYNERGLLGAAKRLLERHRVGIIIVDEAQKTGAQPIESFRGESIEVHKPSVATQKWAAGILFEASTDMNVPLLLVATMELEIALDKRASTLRREFGNGLRHWDPLDTTVVDGRPADYDLYMSALWQQTLLQQHPQYDIEFRNAFHYYTFGIPDFMLKLYYVVQWRALQEGRETFTISDVHHVARTYFKAVTRLTGHMRRLSERFDQESAQFLASRPDLAPEFGLKYGHTGSAETPLIGLKQAKEDALQPPPARAGRGALKRKPETAQLPTPAASHYSAIGGAQ
jgi:hypothetical protein